MVHLKARVVIVLTIFICGCKHTPPLKPQNITGYPADIERIIVDKCATSGCHNNASYKAAGGLNLTTWEQLFNGGTTGAVVIPYRPDFSTLCYYTNTDTNLGVTLIPTMPVNQPALTKKEYQLLSDWVKAGAHNTNGLVKFSDNPSRKKFYLTNKLCDNVTVVDMESQLQMRYIDVGISNEDEFPHSVKVSPDKNNWYVTFFRTSNIVQKFDANTDTYLGDVHIGSGSWTSFSISTDSKNGYFISNKKEGKLAIANLETLQLVNTFTFQNQLEYPSGIIVNDELHKIYIGNTHGNFLYSIDIRDINNPQFSKIILDGSKNIKRSSSIDPAELIIDVENNICYVACIADQSVKIIDMLTDSVISTVKLSTNPAFLSLSKKHNKLVVTCPDDEQHFAGERGAVAVVDIITNSVQKWIYSGYQPYGIAVDDEEGIVAVANANLSTDGDEPHHSSDCQGRNGYISFIDLKTLEKIPSSNSEVAVFPYSISAR